MDVHKQSISIAVGTVTMECVIETKANTCLQFVDGLRGDLRAAFKVAVTRQHGQRFFFFWPSRPMGQPASLPT